MNPAAFWFFVAALITIAIGCLAAWIAWKDGQ